MVDKDKKKLEMIDVEPSDYCDFSSNGKKFPGPDKDQEIKEKMAKDSDK